MKATVFDIERNSYVDGPGIRTTVFFKGCNLRCGWCHNPESHIAAPQMMFHANKCTGCGTCKKKCPNALERCELCGKCALYCPHDARQLCGKEYTAEELLREVRKDLAFYETSGGGVTCSGGECMLQPDVLAELLRLCKEAGIHTAVDTAGHVPYERFERILPFTDLVLYDVKCFDREKHKRYTGVDNGSILENLAKLLRTGRPVWVRIPVLAGVNDSEEELLRIRDFLEEHGSAERVELLPYHGLGEHKYAALGLEAHPFEAPSGERLALLRGLFE